MNKQEKFLVNMSSEGQLPVKGKGRSAGVRLTAMLLGAALMCVLLLIGCNKLAGSNAETFDPDKKPVHIPQDVHKYTLSFSGTQGVTLGGFYQAYEPDGTESMEVWVAQTLPLTVEVNAACVRGSVMRGGDPGTLELEILCDDMQVEQHTCSLVPGGFFFRYPEDQG